MKPDYFHSVILEPEKCIGCTCCLKICPTEAIRIINGKASIIAERCIDCGECIRVCPDHAKSAITDNLDIIKNYKYCAALTLPVLYGQFKHVNNPGKILGALKSLGFDEVYDTSSGSKVYFSIIKQLVDMHTVKPVISSTCPATLRLMQVRFPELLNNILDVETPVEISARIIKSSISERTGLRKEDIGIILITPCTARVTSIKNPIGIDYSYIDGTISIKQIFGPILKALSSKDISEVSINSFTYENILYNNMEGLIMPFKDESTLFVDGIHNAIPILEEVEMEKLNDISFMEISACPGGCIGGPLVVENRYIASSSIKKIASSLKSSKATESEIKEYMDMYHNGLIRLTKKIEPKEITRLDQDIINSIKKMDAIQNIAGNLPGINCGICGSPTCQSFAEDIVTDNNSADRICPLVSIMDNPKK